MSIISKKRAAQISILGLLFVPFFASAQQVVSVGYFSGRFTLGDNFSTSTQIFNQYQGSLPVGIRQTLPPNLTGPVTSFLLHASAGTYACLLDRDVNGGQWADNAPQSNGIQVLCDFSSFALQFVSTSTYHLTLYHAGNPSSGPVTVYGSEAQTQVFMSGFDGQQFAVTLPDANGWTGGASVPLNMKTLYVNFSASSTLFATTTVPTNFVPESCASLDFFCYGRNLVNWAFVPPVSFMDNFVTFSNTFKHKPPMGYVIEVQDSFSTLTATSGSSTWDIYVPDVIKTYVIDPIRAMLVILVSFFALIQLYKRVKHIEI